MPAAGVLAAGMPATKTFLFDTSLAVFAFLLPKIVMWGQQLAESLTYHKKQQVYQRIMTRRPAFRFYARKNCNVAAGVRAAGVQAAEPLFCL